MSSLRWRALVVSFLMVATAAFSYAARPTQRLSDIIGKPDLETLFPAEFAGWRIDRSMPVVLPSPDLQAKLDSIYNQVLARTYINRSGERIMLSVAYGGDQSDGTRAHRPEVCYPAQGFQISSNEVATVSTADRQIVARRLMSSLGSRKEPITYWVSVGGTIATTATEQRLAEIRYGLKGVIADGMLIRVSSIDPDMRRGHALQAKFIADLAAALPEVNRGRIFGSTNALIPS
jgi:EpsI family protein